MIPFAVGFVRLEVAFGELLVADVLAFRVGLFVPPSVDLEGRFGGCGSAGWDDDGESLEGSPAPVGG